MGLGIEPCAQLGLKQSADSLMKKYDLCSRACRGGWILVIRRWGSNGRSAQKAVIPRRCGEWVQIGSKGLYCSETIKVALTTARLRSTEMYCDLAG